MMHSKVAPFTIAGIVGIVTLSSLQRYHDSSPLRAQLAESRHRSDGPLFPASVLRICTLFPDISTSGATNDQGSNVSHRKKKGPCRSNVFKHRSISLIRKSIRCENNTGISVSRPTVSRGTST
ncbi:hypothetical protein L218DRAFT_699904 [Marasmius fiardii PR-910]|nr:hypothetical protein L218DRAFT_699904 [Marasmius fiardii PR-910]